MSAGNASLWAFDDAECEALATEHGTPLFGYRADVVTAAYERLRAALPSRVRLAYAVKANPHPALVRHLVDLGASLDCASLGELRLADAAGARDLYMTGPAKQRHELELAASLGARIQAESWEDVATLDAIVEAPTAVNVRVNLRDGVTEANRIIGGTGPSAFGVDEEKLEAFLTRCRGLRFVQVRGLHVFAASNERSAKTLLRTYALVFALARRMHDEGVPIEQIDVGGGLGVPYAPEHPALDVEALGCGVADLLAENDWFDGELMLEPGRYLSAACGVYLSRVVRVKRSRGTRFVILQGGVNHLLRPLLTGEAFPVRRVGGAPATSGSPATLAGPLCTSLDRLGEAELPDDVAPGDLLAFGMAGAYGFTEAMTNFLLHPVPDEVWVTR